MHWKVKSLHVVLREGLIILITLSLISAIVGAAQIILCTCELLSNSIML